MVPNIGEIVWFWPPSHEFRVVSATGRPLAAIVVHVHEAAEMVNLVVFDAQGNIHRFTSVPFLTDGLGRRSGGFFAERASSVTPALIDLD